MQMTTPSSLPDKIYATWVGGLDNLGRSQDSRRAVENFQFSCGYLQALQEGGIVTASDYLSLRGDLLQVWSEVIGKFEQEVQDISFRELPRSAVRMLK